MQIGEPQNMGLIQCLACDADLSGVSKVGEGANDKPSPGDVSVCVYCGHVQAFDDDLKLRELTGFEMLQTSGDVRIMAIKAAVARTKAAKQ